MKPFFTNRYRHIKRYREIINILTKHGFGYLLELTGLRRALKIPWHKRSPQEQIGKPKRLRMVLEELGPTFIKLGQIISTRPDILPENYLNELEYLQDKVAPVGFAEIKHILESELDQPLHQIFSYISETPIASASIGQVHEAFFLNGEHVVIKVQRSGLKKVIETDLEILYDIAGFLESRTEWGKIYNLQSFVDEFARSIRDELDYLIEAKNAERFRDNFKDNNMVHFPKVYWEYTTEQVMALEYVSGIKITHLSAIDQIELNRQQIAERLANVFFKQILIDGFFHADPHPGNIAVKNDGIIIFMDFGMVGRLEGWIIEILGAFLLGVIRKDTETIAKILNGLAAGAKKPNQRHLKRDIHYLFDKYLHRPLKEIKIGAAFRDLMTMAWKYQLQLPQELALIARCLILLENLVERLAPENSLIELAKPFSSKLLLERLAPKNIGRVLLGYFLEIIDLAGNLPGKLNNILRLLADGEFKILLEHRNFEIFISKLTVIGNRLSFSLIIAATIIGSSLISLKTPESLFGHFPVAEAGFIAAVLMGLWLLIAIIKSGRI